MLLLLLIISIASAHFTGKWLDSDNNTLVLSSVNNTFNGTYNNQLLTGSIIISNSDTAFIFSTNNTIWTGIYQMVYHNTLTSNKLQDSYQQQVTYTRNV